MNIFNTIKKNNPNPGDKLFENPGKVNLASTFLVSQFCDFLIYLGDKDNSMLTDREKEAFKTLWRRFCDNNREKVGNHLVFDKDGIQAGFVTKRSTVENDLAGEYYRTTFYYKSPQGCIECQQNDRNKDVVLLYASKKISKRLLKGLRFAEAKALGIKYDENTDGFELINSAEDSKGTPYYITQRHV